MVKSKFVGWYALPEQLRQTLIDAGISYFKDRGTWGNPHAAGYEPEAFIALQ